MSVANPKTGPSSFLLSFFNLRLNASTYSADTVSLSNLFHFEMTQFDKKFSDVFIVVVLNQFIAVPSSLSHTVNVKLKL